MQETLRLERETGEYIGPLFQDYVSVDRRQLSLWNAGPSVDAELLDLWAEGRL